MARFKRATHESEKSFTVLKSWRETKMGGPLEATIRF